ncbi:MAG: hypothetical protein ABIJ34_01730 [archaeon]
MKTKSEGRVMDYLAIILAVILVAGAGIVFAVDPEGATLTNVSTSQKAASQPNIGNHSKGAINTIRLSSVQQDQKWKAYVGNVSSSFVLDDSDGYSIYQWTVSSFTGQVYITRDTPTWANIACANETNKSAEDTMLTQSSLSSDSVNKTFATQTHKGFTVGGKSIVASTCFATATWVNDTSQTLTVNSPFQEVLLWDGDAMVYTTFVENDRHGYRGDESTTNTTYDFQAIVPENATAGSPNLFYYFYIELFSS